MLYSFPNCGSLCEFVISVNIHFLQNSSIPQKWKSTTTIFLHISQAQITCEHEYNCSTANCPCKEWYYLSKRLRKKEKMKYLRAYVNLTFKVPKTDMTKVTLAEVLKFCPSYITWKIKWPYGKQCRSRYGGSLWVALSGSIILTNATAFRFGNGFRFNT